MQLFSLYQIISNLQQILLLYQILYYLQNPYHTPTLKLRHTKQLFSLHT